jgi:hypothetical protein
MKCGRASNYLELLARLVETKGRDPPRRTMTTKSTFPERSTAPAKLRTFTLNAEKWTEFQAALGAATRPLPRLKSLLEGPGFFESGSSK